MSIEGTRIAIASWVVLAFGATAFGEPGRPSGTRIHAIALTAQAASSARHGNCDPARELDARIRELDPEYHQRVFSAEPAIADCIRSQPPAPTSPEIARDRFMIGGAATLGKPAGGQFDLRLGWMVAPDLAVFATAFFGSVGEDETDTYRVLGGGARLWVTDRVFADARVGYANTHHGMCASGDPCSERGVGFFGGLGVELWQTPRFGLELHAELAGGAGSGILGGGLGISFY